jgi:hypothetical protein
MHVRASNVTVYAPNGLHVLPLPSPVLSIARSVQTTPTGRRMLSSPSAGFVRGSYTGFTHEAAEEKATTGRRSLLQTGNFTCTVASYGFTNRNIQPLNGRKLVDFI